MSRPAQRHGFVAGGAAKCRNAFLQHQPAYGAEQDDVEQRNDEIELADAAQEGEYPHADRRPQEAADEQNAAELDVEGSTPEMRDRA